MKHYEQPKLEFLCFMEDDVIRTSNYMGTGNANDTDVGFGGSWLTNGGNAQ